jgi:co-chaperonin GroES (HSP10)
MGNLLNNFVIIKLDEGDETMISGNLVLHTPDKYRVPKKTGTVRGVGRGIVTAGGELIPPQVKVGDRVQLFEVNSKIQNQEAQIEYQGEQCLLMMDESKIIYILDQPQTGE